MIFFIFVFSYNLLVSNLKKLKLKKKTKLTKFKILLLTIFFMIMLTLLVLNIVGKKINNKILVFAEAEVSKLSKLIVNKAVSDAVTKTMVVEKLFIIERNSDNDIQLIDFDPRYVNRILSDISDTIIQYFEELEAGYSTIIDIKNNLITNTDISSEKEGIIFEIPLGVISNNALLANLGPKVPVRISFNGELESSLKTDIQNYGINSAVITVSANISVSEQILMPVTSKQITISNDIPIAIKIIQGKIPNYYLNGFNENSNLYTIPFDG